MSVGEIVGLALVALLVGLLVGMWTGGRLRRRRQRHWRRERMEAYARWLAAGRTHSRASTSLVAAFRFLAVEPPGSANHALRQEEAQRARAYWCETVQGLDQAEAALIVLDETFDADQAALNVGRPDAGVLQGAITGTKEDVKRLLLALASADRRARDAARAALHRPDQTIPERLVQIARGFPLWMKKILDGWSQV